MQETLSSSGSPSVWAIIAAMLLVTGGLWLITYMVDNFLWTPDDREIES